MDFSGKVIALGIGGGIAAYKACDLIRELQRHNAKQVVPLLTEAATQFVTPLTLASLAKTNALTDPLGVDAEGIPWHIALAQQADVLVIVPATANLLARLHAGLADDLVTTTALTMTGKPVVLAPAMNTRMWDNPVTQRNWHNLLQLSHVSGVSPASGLLACGETGTGHLPALDVILRAIYRQVHPFSGQLAGVQALVTAGGTREPLDPVRELTNRSSGRMGVALADELYAMGAEVVLLTAQQEPPTREYRVYATPTVASMQQALEQHASTCHFVYKAAAVSDFSAADVAVQKIKKPLDSAQPVPLSLVRNPDLLAELGRKKPVGQVLVGFAAETHNGLEHAYRKLADKQLDWMVLNDVSRSDIGFQATHNEVTLLQAKGAPIRLAKAPKWAIARAIVCHTAGLACRQKTVGSLSPASEGHEPFTQVTHGILETELARHM